MAEKGQVINIKDNLAIIQMTRTEACAKCRACIAGMSKKEMIVEAENECDAKVGDWVEMELRDNGFLRAVLIMYGIPMIALFIGLLVGYFVLPPYAPWIYPEILSCLVGIFFTALALLWIRSQESRWEAKRYRPIAARLTTEDAEV